MSISHEVKIHILTPKRQQELNEPLCPPPDVSLLFIPCIAAGLMIDPHPSTKSGRSEEYRFQARSDG
jgi:hypothetical protein